MGPRDQAKDTKKKLKFYWELSVLIINLLVLLSGAHALFNVAPNYQKLHQTSGHSLTERLKSPDFRNTRSSLYAFTAPAIFLFLLGMTGTLFALIKFSNFHKPIKSLRERSLSILALITGLTGITLIYKAMSFL